MQNSKIYLVLIIILASILRLYQLGTNPPSLDWDEASLGYNAYSLLKTGKDEFGRPWPISIRSFEDYKPAVYAYLSIPTIAAFGLNEFAVRFPSAVLGILTVLVTYFLVGHLFKNRRYQQKISLMTALLLSISPWHLQFSRAAFEANAGLFFVVCGAWFFHKGLENGKWLILSAFCFGVSFYSYHSPRLVVPILIFGWAIYYFKLLWRTRFWVVVATIFFIVLLIPYLKEFTSVGRARFTSVTVLSSEDKLKQAIDRTEYDNNRGDTLAKFFHNRRIIHGLNIAKGYLDHFNIDFLFLTGDSSDRHQAKDMGMLYLWEAPFIFIGLFTLLKDKKSLPLFWWFLVAPSASALTLATPHAIRSLLYLPVYQIFAAFGLVWFISHKKYIKILVLVLVVINIYYYLEMYYVHTPIEVSQSWQYGYKQAIKETEAWENKVDKIIMTYVYDQPHAFVLFYRQIDPAWYQSQWKGIPVLRQERRFGKYEFRKIDWLQDERLRNVLFVAAPHEIPNVSEQVEEINFLDGSVAFKMVKR